ncbi:hypothetical protein [Streptomyces sp. NPDC092295]|uniref:hypothetical protein n=1 Tax=Streptomyces sp. NPDC092295 TaxID=3366011 RepID=UPI003812F951
MNSRQQLSSRIDQGLARDMAVLKPAGLSNSRMVKEAISLLAKVCAVAWDNGVVPLGEIPELNAYQYRVPPQMQPPAEGQIEMPRTNDSGD